MVLEPGQGAVKRFYDSRKKFGSVSNGLQMHENDRNIENQEMNGDAYLPTLT